MDQYENLAVPRAQRRFLKNGRRAPWAPTVTAVPRAVVSDKLNAISARP